MYLVAGRIFGISYTNSEVKTPSGTSIGWHLYWSGSNFNTSVVRHVYYSGSGFFFGVFDIQFA